MISSVKRILYKILVISMISIVLVFFSASSVCHAKLELNDDEFYYSGTQEGTYIVEAGLWEKVINALSEIASYLLGLFLLAPRVVIVGCIEIMEIILTALVGDGVDMAEVFASGLSGMDTYSQQVVNVEKIIFNEIPMLDANIFK